MSEVITSDLLFTLVERWLSEHITVIGPMLIKDDHVQLRSSATPRSNCC